MNFSYNITINIRHRCTTLRRPNMIIKKSNKLTKIVFGVLELFKACNETKFKSQLLHNIISNFRKAAQILDIVQGLPKLPKYVNIFLQTFTFTL
jgi:hypothetical protein